MCSIIGFYGSEDAAPILVRGLRRMEYRGYDSVGVATRDGSEITMKKGVGKVDEVNSAKQLDQLRGRIGIGHTRWATHGKVIDANAHPHSSNSGKIVVVHNGIIENFEEIKGRLLERGYAFESETDTEVISNLLQYNYEKSGDEKAAMIETLSELKGHYAFVAMFENGKLAAARFHKPLIIGVSSDSYFLSSDVMGFIESTDNAIYVENGNFVIIDGSLGIFEFDGKEVKLPVTTVSKEFADVYKGSFAHYTIKEISEQPETILKAARNTPGALKQTVEHIRNANNIYITGSGSSYNAALIAKYMISKYAKIRVESIISSELPHSSESIVDNSVMIAISQSGESADVLEAVKIAREVDARIISLVNLPTSSLAQESSVIIGMNCGPEIGVAATKSFVSQLAAIYMMTDMLCDRCMKLDLEEASRCMGEILKDHSRIKDITKELSEISDIYVLGRGIHFPIAVESALKIKELAYIHAEGIPGGELKHGSLALMDSDVFVIIINPVDATYEDTLTSAREIKARGAKIIGISDKYSDVYDYWIQIPKIEESMYPLLEVVPMQLLAYYVALEKETDPDYPRNLAKSVTVK